MRALIPRATTLAGNGTREFDFSSEALGSVHLRGEYRGSVWKANVFSQIDER
jgi:hypothetical protein